jgi:hypothetical protein
MQARNFQVPRSVTLWLPYGPRFQRFPFLGTTEPPRASPRSNSPVRGAFFGRILKPPKVESPDTSAARFVGALRFMACAQLPATAPEFLETPCPLYERSRAHIGRKIVPWHTQPSVTDCKNCAHRTTKARQIQLSNGRDGSRALEKLSQQSFHPNGFHSLKPLMRSHERRKVRWRQ